MIAVPSVEVRLKVSEMETVSQTGFGRPGGQTKRIILQFEPSSRRTRGGLRGQAGDPSANRRRRQVLHRCRKLLRRQIQQERHENFVNCLAAAGGFQWRRLKNPFHPRLVSQKRQECLSL